VIDLDHGFTGCHGQSFAIILNRGTWEVLVSWLDRPPTESTWEKLDVFKKTYPDIQLEDKLFLGGREML
jgi:hypothetical protein